MKIKLLNTPLKYDFQTKHIVKSFFKFFRAILKCFLLTRGSCSIGLDVDSDRLHRILITGLLLLG